MPGEKTKDDVYFERNLLAIAFIRTYSAWHLHYHDELPEWGWWDDDSDAYAVVWVNTQEGQVGWHVPIDMVPDWLPERDPQYDGYTTDEKNRRFETLIRSAQLSR